MHFHGSDTHDMETFDHRLFTIGARSPAADDVATWESAGFLLCSKITKRLSKLIDRHPTPDERHIDGIGEYIRLGRLPSACQTAFSWTNADFASFMRCSIKGKHANRDVNNLFLAAAQLAHFKVYQADWQRQQVAATAAAPASAAPSPSGVSVDMAAL
jgi:hypothetical protein